MEENKAKIQALVDLLKLTPGTYKAFNDVCIVYTKYKRLKLHWKGCFYKNMHGQPVEHGDLPNDNGYDNIRLNYHCWWTMFPDEPDWIDELYNKVMAYVRSQTIDKKPLKYIYFNPDPNALQNGHLRKSYRHITNKNLCKIDGLHLRGNVNGLHGILMTTRQLMLKNFNECTIGTEFLVQGTVSKFLYGDITGVFGVINDGLVGDISGITGCVTNIVGDCTGITMHISKQVDCVTNIKALGERPLTGKRTLLSNEDSAKAFNAYRKLAHCTLGLTEEERNMIDVPHKQKPPFQIDRWGRYYVEEDGCTWVYSINPADIMFLKEIGPLNSCFCMTTQSANGRWDYGMRCLMALNCTNPCLACVFKISNDEPTRKMRMFNGLNFTWFKPIDGGFMQYNGNGEGHSWSPEDIDVCGMFSHLNDISTIQKIHGHDGYNLGHDRQKKMAYLEIFIDKMHSWVQDRDERYDLPNKITNNEWDICYDENWNEISKTKEIWARFPDEEIVKAFIEEAKKAKEIINGIKI